jgi:uncharacterized protein with PIN domain
MLGKLSRWLRILGYDTAYEKVIADQVLIERVLTEHRWLLTRDRYLARRRLLRGRHTLLASDSAIEQLRQLRRDLNLTLCLTGDIASRCADCNLVLEPVSREAVAAIVPPFVAREQIEFFQCPGCRRVYWPGTHWTRLCRTIEDL